MTADSPGDMTCEQPAPDSVSADRVLRIAVSFPSVFGAGFAPVLFHGIPTPGDMT
jgi:hypothetical protein